MGISKRRAALALAVVLTMLLPAVAVLAAEPIAQIDLAVTKVDTRDPVQPGEQYSYVIEGTNNGPSGAFAVFIVDTLPPEVEFVSADAGCSHAAGVVTCDIGPMTPTPAAGSSVTRTITVAVPAGTPESAVLDNVVVIENREPNTDDTDPSNNRDTERTDVVTGSIGDFVWQDDDGDGVQDPGEPGIPGVTVNLAGPGGSQSATTDAGGLYLFSPLVSGDYTVMVDTTTVPAGFTPTTPTVVDHTLGLDEDFLDADFGFRPPPSRQPEIDVELVKSVSAGQVSPGQTTTFSITVSNKGPNAATGVTVVDRLPAGLTLQSHDGGAAFDAATLTWNVGTLAAGASQTLSFVVVVTQAGQFTNVAEVMTHNELDVDSTPGNGVLAEDDQDDAVVVAALVQPATTIGDDVFFDSDQDGVRDPGEPGIAGATVTLTQVATGTSATATTNADGKYLFSAFPGSTFFPAGDYSVRVTVPPLAGTGLTRLTTPATFTVTVPTLTGTQAFDDLDNDFGFILALGDLVWYDNDQDGVKDANEQGIPNVELILRDQNGAEIGRVRTDSSGIYGFRLPPGTYTVTVNRATLPSTVSFATVPKSGAFVKTLTTADDLTADFGYCGGPGILPCTGLTTGGIGTAGALLLLAGLGMVVVGRRRGEAAD